MDLSFSYKSFLALRNPINNSKITILLTAITQACIHKISFLIINANQRVKPSILCCRYKMSVEKQGFSTPPSDYAPMPRIIRKKRKDRFSSNIWIPDGLYPGLFQHLISIN